MTRIATACDTEHLKSQYLTYKMAECRHHENRKMTISQQQNDRSWWNIAQRRKFSLSNVPPVNLRISIFENEKWCRQPFWKTVKSP